MKTLTLSPFVSSEVETPSRGKESWLLGPGSRPGAGKGELL